MVIGNSRTARQGDRQGGGQQAGLLHPQIGEHHLARQRPDHERREQPRQQSEVDGVEERAVADEGARHDKTGQRECRPHSVPHPPPFIGCCLLQLSAL
jgi:hypothetical protein